jgi:hypothetical protein
MRLSGIECGAGARCDKMKTRQRERWTNAVDTLLTGIVTSNRAIEIKRTKMQTIDEDD